MVFIDVVPADLERARFASERFEAEGQVEVFGGGLNRGHGYQNLLQAGNRSGALDECVHQCARNPAAPEIPGDIHAPNMTFVMALQGGVAVEAGRADEAFAMESSEDELLGG